MKFIKGKKLFLNGMPFRNIIIAFFAHWTGYASDGKKTGISSNATAGRIEDYLCKHYPDWMDDYYDNGLHMKLIHKVMNICKETYDPPSAAPIYIRKQMQLAWPKVEKFLETTPLIDDNAEFVENTNLPWESMKKTITFKELQKLVNESAKDNGPSWYDVPGTKWIWNGEWADSEVEYDGEIINANELEDYAWDKYRQECKEKGTTPSEEEFDDKLPVSWFKKTLDEFMFDRYGDINESSEDHEYYDDEDDDYCLWVDKSVDGSEDDEKSELYFSSPEEERILWLKTNEKTIKENGAYLRDIFWRVEEQLKMGCPGNALELLDKYEDELRSKYEADYIRLRRKVEAEIIP